MRVVTRAAFAWVDHLALRNVLLAPTAVLEKASVQSALLALTAVMDRENVQNALKDPSALRERQFQQNVSLDPMLHLEQQPVLSVMWAATALMVKYKNVRMAHSVMLDSHNVHHALLALSATVD